MITVWGRKSSSNVQAAMWCIAEMGLEFERHDVGHSFGGNDTAEFLAMNPNGTVPVIRDGNDDPIWETGAILRYLSSQYAPRTFWPNNTARRAQIDKWAEWAKLNIALNFTVPVFWRLVRTAPSKQDPQAIADALAKLTACLEIAEAQLDKSKFLAADTFTLADIQLGHVLFRYYDMDMQRADLPNLRAYYDRLCERPAFVEHVQLPYEDLRVSDGL